LLGVVFIVFAFFFRSVSFLDHAVQEAVDESFAVAEVTALDEVAALLPHATLWWGKLEWPKSVGNFLEVFASSVDLVDHVFNANNSVVVELCLDLLVVGDLHALPVALEVTALVDESANCLERWVTICDVWLDKAEHVLHWLVDLDEDSVEDLTQAQKLQNLALLWCNLGDTTNAHNDGNFWLCLEEEVALVLCLAALCCELGVLGTVCASVVASALERLLAECLLLSLVGDDGSFECLSLGTLVCCALD